MPTLALDGRRLSYEHYWSGRVALLIHGSPENGNTWPRVAERLAGRYRVVAPDLPGYGDTTPQPPEQEPDVGYASELVEALIRHDGPPVVLAGHSYGAVVMHFAPEFADVGGLIAYGPDVAAMYRRASVLVDKIRKGAKPTELPVEQARNFELVFNLKTTTALGLTVPRSLLLRADRVLE